LPPVAPRNGRIRPPGTSAPTRSRVCPPWLTHFCPPLNPQGAHPLKDELRKRIAWTLSQPQSESTYFESPLRCFVGRVPLVGRVLHIIDQAITLLPGAWERLNVVLLTGRRNSPSIPQPLPLAVRLFTLAGPLDFPFTVAFWEGGASQQNLGCAFGTRAGPGFPSASRLTSARLLQGPEW